MNRSDIYKHTYLQPSQVQFDYIMGPMYVCISKIKQPTVALVRKHLGNVHRSLESEIAQTINDDKTQCDKPD